MTARQRWKIYWRALRVARREAGKALHDVMLYGTGYVQYPPGEDPVCIHPRDVKLEPPA